MKDTTKITVGYQFRHMIRDHITAIFVALFFQLAAFGWAFDKAIVKEIIGTLFTLVYFFMIYGAASETARHDNKSYTPLNPDKKKGFLMGLMLAVISIVLFCGYKLVWAFCSADGALTSVWAVVVNALFLVWNFQYFGFMGSAAGIMPIYTVVLMVAVPILASSLGYIAVCNKFDLWDKILSFIYVKKDK